MDAEKEPISIEAVKIRFDLFKHLTTLSTASVIAVGSAAQGLIELPKADWLLLVAIILFLLSVGGSVLGMIFGTAEARTLKQWEPKDRKEFGRIATVSLGGFFGGLGCALFFLWMNLTGAL